MRADGPGTSRTRWPVAASGAPGAIDPAVGDAPEESVLGIALATSRLISEAKVLLMERHDVDAEEAFALLRQYSRTSHLPIRDVARQLVRHEWLPPDD